MKNSERQRQIKTDSIAEITSHAHAEIAWVRTAYKFAATIIGVIIIFGIYFTYEKAEDYRNEIRDESKAQQERMEKDVNALEEKLIQDMQLQANQVRQEVAQRLDSEFADSNIVTLVHNQAKERIDAIADVLIQKDITNQITPIRVELLALLSTNEEEAKIRIEKIDKAVEESRRTGSNLEVVLTDAKDTLKRLDERSDFIMSVIAAENDDRAAFEKLNNWASDANCPERQQALAALEAVKESYVGFEKPYANVIPWVDTNKPHAYAIDQIQNAWKSMPPIFARAYVDFVWTHTNIDRNQKLVFLHSMLSNSQNSLKAEDKAAHILSDELHAHYNPPFDNHDIEDKWQEYLKTNQVASVSTNKIADKP